MTIGTKATRPVKATASPARAKSTAKKAPAKPAVVNLPPPAAPPGGWYPDPADPSLHRRWDGQAWTAETVRADEITQNAEELAASAAAPATTTEEQRTSPITFQGRVMQVKIPAPEALVVWQRTVTKMTDYDGKVLLGEDGRPLLPNASPAAVAAATVRRNTVATRLLSRAISVVTSVLADEDDVDWVEEQLLGGKLTLLHAADIMTLSIDAFKTEPAAPTTGPAPKARRR